MNILCNPTGKKGKFRALDWVIEHHNFFLKVSKRIKRKMRLTSYLSNDKRVYGGKFSNHTKARIIKESCLIELYRRIRIDVEEMFLLENQTNNHSLPDMHDTFSKLAWYIEKEDVNEFIRGRKAKYTVPNAIGEGMDKMFGLSRKVDSSVLWADLPDDNVVNEDHLDDLGNDI